MSRKKQIHAMNYFIGVLKKYAVFTGRADRSEFWWFILYCLIISIVLNVVTQLTHFPLLSILWQLAILLPSIGVGIRRMHDIGKCGWFILIPVYNLYLFAQPGENTANKYGEAPAK